MRGLFLSLLVLLPATSADARSLRWSSFDVEARLDADGVLHVSERQAIVFDGDWNGGERVFDLRPGQRLRFESLYRIDPATGAETRLSRGSLDTVDNWDWEERHHLRWRSRRPSDPPFDQQTIVYRLDYSLLGIVRADGDSYHLDHNFAPHSLAGVIDEFTVELVLDPAWIASPDLERRWKVSGLYSGRDVLATATLGHAGTAPAAVERTVPDHRVYALAIAVLCLLGLKLPGLWRAETALGRRRRPAVPDPITREWLDEVLFSLRPEEAGALWDRKVGAPEVAAVIARLVAEGRLISRVSDPGGRWRKPTMELELARDRCELSGYERSLVDKLFFDGRTRTDTRALRRHYRKSGFDPATEIRPGIAARLKRLGDEGPAPVLPSWKPTALLFAAFVTALGLEAWARGPLALAPLIAALAIVTPVPVIAAYVAAVAYRSGLGRPPLAWLPFLVPLALLAAGCLFVAWSGAGGRELFTDLRPGIFGALSLALLASTVGVSVLNQARTRERRGILARRQLLAAARRHVREQLASPVPLLEDGWFPYILAFGLSRRADAWARRFGPPAQDASRVSTTSWSPASGTGWTGGGGAFGGAGATAAWTAAATGLAAGVSAPSSSGGSGGGGGSSGGGGAGGW